MVLPTRAAAASGDGGASGLGDPEETSTTTSTTSTTTTTTTTIPAPTAAYEPRVDFLNQFNSSTGSLNLDVYMGWGATYSNFSFGTAAGKVSGVTSADKSDFDFTISYTTNSPEQVQTATGSSSNGYASRTVIGLKSGSIVTVTLTSKTTAGSTNPAGVERTFTHTR